MRNYTATDVELLAEMDRAHGDVCGPAVAHLLQRAHTVYGDPRYERLADLSVSHLYNLRKRADHQARRVSFNKTRAVCNPIGLRKAPKPQRPRRLRAHRHASIKATWTASRACTTSPA